MAGRIGAAVLVTAAFVVWAMVVVPERGVAAALLLLAATPVAVAVAGVLTRTWQTSAGWPSHLPAAAAGLAATVLVWSRVWSRYFPEESGILPGLLTLFTFWFPGLLAAALVLAVERVIQAPPASLGGRLAAGLAAGLVGAVVAVAGGSSAFARIDPHVLGQLVARHAGPLAAGTAEPTFASVGSRLEVKVPVGEGTSWSSLRARQWAERAARAATLLLEHPRVAAVVLTATGPDGSRLIRTEADATREARSDFGGLPGGGRLDEASLRDLAVPYLDPEAADPFEEWGRRFSARLTGASRVEVTFDPPGPPTAQTIDWYAAGYESANAVVNGVATWFGPGHTYSLAFPGGTVEVDGGDIEPGRFAVQPLLPGHVPGILRLHVTFAESEAATDFDDYAFGPGGERPVLVVSERYGPPVGDTGDRFEALRLQPGVLFVLDVSPTGDATIVVEDATGVRHPAVTVPAGGAVRIGDSTVRNLWVDRMPRSVR